MGAEGKVAIVTGASAGIGEATALAFARAGLRVALAARRKEELERVASRIRAAGGEALVVPTNVRDQTAIEALVQATLAAWGRIDVLFANAGIGLGGPFHKADEERILSQVEVNLLGVMRCVRATLPTMLAQGSGHIMVVSSVAGAVATPMNIVYSATKAGLTQFSLGLRREVRRRGVEVSVILPGFIATPMTANQKFPVPIPGPEIVARAALRLLARPRRAVVVPGYYRALVALERWLPGLMDWGIARTIPHYRQSS